MLVMTSYEAPLSGWNEVQTVHVVVDTEDRTKRPLLAYLREPGKGVLHKVARLRIGVTAPIYRKILRQLYEEGIEVVF